MGVQQSILIVIETMLILGINCWDIIDSSHRGIGNQYQL